MRIGKDCAVTIARRVSVMDGTVIDDGAAPTVYIHGGYHDIFDKIEQALEGKSVGDAVTVHLEPKDAFGECDPDLIIAADIDQFEKPPALNDSVERAHGDRTQLFRVLDIRDGVVVLDGNHPLAGSALEFQAQVLSIRRATVEEVAQAEQAVTVGISRPRALRMAAANIVGAPVVLLVIVAVATEWLGAGILSWLALLACLAVLIACLRIGARHLRDVVRGGPVLRLDVKGLYWRDFGAMVNWEDIAKIKLGGLGEDALYTVTLTDQRSFRMDASTLSVSAQLISRMFAAHLPAAKLEGL